MPTNEPIAIVGSGCRFAGDNDSPSKLWELLREPHDICKEIPASRFSVEGFYHPNGAYHGHSNVRHAYLMDNDPSQFDTEFFGIKPSEAKSMDPQQRLLLEVVYESIEAAGMTITGLIGSDTAVYAGLMTNDYGMMLTRDLAHVPTYHATGISSAIVSNRVSYFFDWHGPSMTVDTGCSASLVALHLAVQSLRNGESRMALACGTNLILGPEYFIIESKLKMLSPDGRSKMWDQEANGYARGDGVTAVVLKTLSAALADGDHIECIIRETGLNQDGSTPGITMPSAAAQEALIRSTYAKAGLNLRSPSDRPQYFEAHGTGTPAGDPIEAEAINKAFFRDSLVAAEDNASEEHPLYVGSIKTVLGHTEGSAGIAAILKASLALQNSTIPPNLLFNKLSDRVAPFYDNLEIAREAKPWPKRAQGQVRRASVNSFGFGGANAHAILESYSPPQPKVNGVPDNELPLFTPLVFSASSEKSLKAILTSYATYLSNGPDIDIRDLAWTLRERRALLPFRASFSASGVVDLAAKIKSQLQQDGANIGVKALPLTRSGKAHGILGVFTGQGAQYARMGAELIESSPAALSIIKDLEMMLDDLPVNDRPTWSLKAEILANAKSSRVHEATISQPLCTAVQIMMVDLLQLAKVDFSAVVGHSSGEIAAAYAAGFLTAREAICIAYYRGLHLNLAESPHGKGLPGAMLAVGSSMENMSKLCASERFIDRISVAASNSSSSVTISGDEGAIAELQVVLDTQKTFNRRLKVDKAYHSAHMSPCGVPYINSLRTCVRERQVQDPERSCVWYSSVYNKAIDPVVGIAPTYWADNMAKPVLFSQALQNASAGIDFEIAVEVGAHPALKGPASQTIGEALSSEKTVPYFGTLSRGTSAVHAFATALGQLWSFLGPEQIRFDVCEKSMSCVRTSKHNVVKGLPSYPWDHTNSYWHEARASRHLRLRQKPVHPLLGDVTPDSTLHHLSWRNLLRMKEMEWLSGHAIQGQAVFPAAGYMCSALEAARLLASGKDIRLIELANFTIHQAVVLPEDDAGIEVLIELVDVPTARSDCLEARFTYSAAVGHNVETLALAASATVIVKLGTPSTSVLPTSSTGLKLTHATKVDTDSFYSALAELGYNFSGRFCSLSQLMRKHRKSFSLIQAEPSEPGSESLLIHPAELDAAFQAILLACSYPNDEQLRALHLPTVIHLIRVNPALCSSQDTKSAQLLPIEGAIVPGADGEIGVVGDVNFFSTSSPNAMIQVQGAKLVPFGGAAAEKEDRNLFSTTHWISNNLEGTSYKALDQHQHAAMKVMERMSAFYLRQFDCQLPSDHPSRSTRPLSFYLDHARRTTSLVDGGKHGLANKGWIEDTLDSVISASSEFTEVLDVRVMHLVGEHMPRALRGETTMIEEFRKADILGDYYTNGVVIQASASWIIGMMKQIVDRFPHMNILEIGAGSGEGVTSRIPRAIDSSFLSYTYANVSGSIQPDGTAFFSQANDPKPVRTFDAELEPANQGYVEGSYDVIIAFWVMHATKNLESSLRNLRKLLKPGGYLIIAEGSYTSSGSDGGLTFIFGTLGGWWLGADQGRTLNPYLSTHEWDQILKSTGFSGVDVTPPKELADTFGAAVFLSQAVDEQVSFLRDPVAMLTASSSPVDDLVIVGGTSPRSSHLVEGLQSIFSQIGSIIHQFGILEEVDYSVINHQTIVVSLTELDEPAFLNMTERRFAAFKQMFAHGKKLLWVTSGRLDHQPYSNITLGFGRTALVETPDLLLQQLDVANPLAIEAHDIARTLLRFASTIPETTLWNVEAEILVDAARDELIPRLKPIPTFNNRHNSSAREIKQLISTNESEVALKMTDSGCTARHLGARFPKLPEDYLQLRTMHSSSTAMKTTVGHQFLVSCRHEPSQKTYLALVPLLASTYRLPMTSVVPYSDDTTHLSLLAAQLVSSALLDTVSAGSTVVVHNAVGQMAIAIKAQASFLGIDLVFTSDSTADVAVGCKLTPYLTQYELNQILPTGVALFVGLSVSEDQRELNESAMMSFLPRHCRRESSTTLFGCEGLSSTVGTANALRNALNKVDNYDPADLQQARSLTNAVDISSILTGSVADNPLETIDWTTSTALPITVDRADNQQTFSRDKTYWILGLSAALGTSLFDWMIRRGAKNLVFSSRKPQLDATWVDFHRRSGVRIEVIACDLTEETTLKRAHSEICNKLPPVAGVLNGAALFRDNSILNMSFVELNDSLRPKVLGTLYLDRIFHDHDLEFFILTSSITGLLGSAGQANYTAANTFMCGLAAQRRRRGLAATAINLGAIAGVGLLERGDKKVLESIIQRLSLMPVSEGDFHQIFAEAIEAGRHDCALCGPELTTALRAVPFDEPNAPAFFSNPMFSHFRMVGLDQQKTKGSKANSTKELLAVCETKAELQSIIKGAFSNEMRKTLQTTTTDDELMEMRSIDLGIDSLVSIDLRTWFTKNLKVNIPVLKIMSNDPMGDLVLFAVEHVPAELVPMMTDRVVSEELVNGDSKAEIDWDMETAPPADLTELAAISAVVTSSAAVPETVALTGASGMLGHHILTTLLEQPSIKKIHCLAVRRLEERLKKGELLQDDRVVYHAGELYQPRLGLSAEESASIFEDVDAVVHNGADTSHLKSYFDLKPSNVESTVELIRLCLPRRIPLHFISSNAVGRYSNKEQIGEVAIYSPGAPRPPTDGSSGYRSTKWAAETLLERVYESTHLPILIHRPSTIIRTGKDAEGQAAQLDWMNALIWYMDKLSAVPKLNHGTGFLDLVYSRTVCTGIVSHVLESQLASRADKVLYVHHMADLLLPLAKLEDFSKGSGREFRQLPREEWTTKAVAAGMHPAVVVLIEMMDAPDLKGPPMFVKGPGSPLEPLPN